MVSVDSRRAAYPWHVIIPVVVYLVLSLAGVTQSSIGISFMREDPDALHSPMLLSGQTIRTDEYLTATPMALGVMVTGSPEQLNPLAAPQAFLLQLPSGPVSSVVLFDGTALELGPALPDSVLLAAHWWFPFLLLALGAPAYFRRLTGSRSIGWFAAALIVLSPLSAWWSFGPVSMVATSFAGAASLQLGVAAWTEDRRWAAGGWCLLSAILLARAPLYYQPWAVILVPAILLTAVLGLVAKSERRGRAVVAIALTAVVAVGLFSAVLLENRDAITATLGTTYPGHRVESGSPNPFQFVFGATNLGVLVTDPPIKGSNASEISSAFSVGLVWAVLLLLRGVRFRDAGHKLSVIGLLAITAFWLAWSTVSFGSLGSHLPIVNIVPPNRAAAVVGVLATVLLCLLLPGTPDRGRAWFAALTAVGVGTVAAIAGVLLRAEDIPSMSASSIWLSSLLLGAAVFVCTWRPRFWGGYALCGLLGLLLVGLVNPVLVGLGDLRNSDVAQRMLTFGAHSRAQGELWASDNVTVDALFEATGVPSLSGRQIAGPNKPAWRRLSTDPAAERVWNRGGSFIKFRWSEGEKPTFSNPRADSIIIDTSPCALARHEPRLSHIVATHRLTGTCLKPSGHFGWGGQDNYVYDVVR